MTDHTDTPVCSIIQVATAKDISRVVGNAKGAKLEPLERGVSGLDAKTLLSEHSIAVRNVTKKDGCTYYHLEHCLFNPDHTYNSVALVEAEDGKLGYSCRHDSCSERRIKDVFAILGVDVSALKSAAVECSSGLEVFCDQCDEPHARIRVDGCWQIRKLRSKHFTSWLTHSLYEMNDKFPASNELENHLRLMEYTCFYESGRRDLHVRVARADGAIWIDLCDAKWRAVKIANGGWDIIDEPPPLFYRHKTNCAQVLPTPGGSVELLRPYLNVADDNAWVQVIVWIIAAFVPDIAHPVLVLHGEQGTSKTSFMQILSRIIDPSVTGVRAAPTEEKEWVQAASHSWMIGLDNLTSIPQWFSDGLCRAVTGDAFSKRALYSDDDDFLYKFRRVIVMSGVQQVVQKPDLLDRAILVALDPIPPEKRKSEEELRLGFEEVLPALFGAILDIVAQVWEKLPDVRLRNLPRMADFARVGVAVEQVLGWKKGAFMSAYQTNITGQHVEAIEASVVAQAVRQFMDGLDEWEGTVGQLKASLEDQICCDTDRLPSGWPRTPKGLAGKLRENAPNLRYFGIEMDWRRSNGSRLITLTNGQKSVEQ